MAQHLPLPWSLETERHYIPAIGPSGVSETVALPVQGGPGGPPQLPYLEPPSLGGLGEALSLLVAVILALALAAVYLRLIAPPEPVRVVYSPASKPPSTRGTRGPWLYRYWGERARVRRALDSAFKACRLPSSATPRVAGASKGVEGWASAERVLYARSWGGGDVEEALRFARELGRSCRGSGGG